jgi:multidrug efflux pump subunit AcrB
MGFTLNVVTLLSAVAGGRHPGRRRHRRDREHHAPPAHGQDAAPGGPEAADEIGLAVIATTFTLIAVFLPTAFMSGIPGKFFVQFGWTAAIAVFFSLVVARMLTPMMAAYMLKPPAQRHGEPRWLPATCVWARWCLKHRWLTLAGGHRLLRRLRRAGAAAATGFIPPDDCRRPR